MNHGIKRNPQENVLGTFCEPVRFVLSIWRYTVKSFPRRLVNTDSNTKSTATRSCYSGRAWVKSLIRLATTDVSLPKLFGKSYSRFIRVCIYLKQPVYNWNVAILVGHCSRYILNSLRLTTTGRRIACYMCNQQLSHSHSIEFWSGILSLSG